MTVGSTILSSQIRGSAQQKSRMALDGPQLRNALGHYPTGVCVVTARTLDNALLGLVVGSFTSVSLEPALVGFLPARSSGTWAQMAECAAFGINVLAEDQEDLCRQMVRPGPDKFSGVALDPAPSGVPMIRDAILQIHCTPYATQEAGDHWFVLGRVDRIEVMREKRPLLFHRGAYCNLSASGLQPELSRRAG